MDSELKGHLVKILRALGRIKRVNYEPDVQIAISSSGSLLDSILSFSCPEEELSKKTIDDVVSYLNKIRVDVFGGNKEVVESINKVIAFFEPQTKNFFKK